MGERAGERKKKTNAPSSAGDAAEKHGCPPAKGCVTLPRLMSSLYDTHAHLDHPGFATDLPDLIARSEAAGVTRIIAIGTPSKYWSRP